MKLKSYGNCDGLRRELQCQEGSGATPSTNNQLVKNVVPSSNGDRRPGHQASRLSHVYVKRYSHFRWQPAPATPGLSKQVVRQHARQIFRDKWSQRGLTLKEWRLAEKDLAQKLETAAL